MFYLKISENTKLNTISFTIAFNSNFINNFEDKRNLKIDFNLKSKIFHFNISAKFNYENIVILLIKIFYSFFKQESAKKIKNYSYLISLILLINLISIVQIFRKISDDELESNKV